MKTIIILLLAFQLQAQTASTTLGKVLLSIKRDNVSIFVNSVYKDAKRITDSTNIPIAIVIGQSALETKYGESRLCVEDNNHFGIRRNHKFMVYESRAASFDDYKKVLCQECYRKEKPEKLQQWYDALEKCGYFTSKTYIKKLNNIIFTYNLDLL